MDGVGDGSGDVEKVVRKRTVVKEEGRRDEWWKKREDDSVEIVVGEVVL